MELMDAIRSEPYITQECKLHTSASFARPSIECIAIKSSVASSEATNKIESGPPG